MMDFKWYRARLPWIVVGLSALVLAERLFMLVDRYAVNIFFSDQWEFNDATLFQQHSWWQVFAWQHGPHRQGLGGVLAKLIEPLFQWDSRIESFWVAGIFVVAMLLALWLKQRVFGALDYYDVVIPSLCLTATQCESIFGAANLAHGSLPLLLVVLYCLAWTIRNPLPRFAAVLAVNFLLVFTGFGLMMGLITPLAILTSLWSDPPAKGQIQIHLSAVAISLVSVGLFFVHYAWNPAVDCYSSALVSRTPGDYLRFAALMYANYLGFDGLSSRHPAAWGAAALAIFTVLLMVVVLFLARSRNGKKENSVSRALVIAFALLAFSLAFCVATARGRLCLGFSAAQESRYMPYLTPSFLGGYFALRRVLTVGWARHAALSSFLLVSAYAGWPVHLGDQLEMSGFHSGKLNWKNCYLTTRDAQGCTRQTRTRICNAPETPHLQEKLDFLEKDHLNLFNGR